MSYIIKKDSLDLVSALFMLLTNLTREDSGKRELMRFDSLNLKGANLVTLFTWFYYFKTQK